MTFMVWTSIAAVAALGYLLGSIPFGFLVAKLKGVDIRKAGSGNIGATNVFRVVGKSYGIAVFILDFMKGLLPVVVSGSMFRMTGGGEVVGYGISLLAGLSAILGHNFSCWLGFKGGKGIATSAGVLLALMPFVMLGGLIVWVVVFVVSRYVSLASIAAAIALPAILWLYAAIGLLPLDPYLLGFSIVIATLAVWRHRTNIQRLLNGTEHRMTSKK